MSAFNNAGFSLFSDNLMRYRGDLVVNLVITGLIILGGLGFFVLRELRRQKTTIPGLSACTPSWRSPSTAAPARRAAPRCSWRSSGATRGRWASSGWGETVLAAWFQAVTPRTAGFNTIDIGGMTTAGLFVTIVLMFIGASPGGTGGGVKTTTFGVTVVALWATVRGPDGTGGVQAAHRHRGRGAGVLRRASSAFLALNGVAALLLLTEGRDLLRTLFETTSAFGTVGLSMGLPGSVAEPRRAFSARRQGSCWS